jgi:hypothetical protein
LNDQVDIYSAPALIINEQNKKEKIIPNYLVRNNFNQNRLKYYNFLIHGTLIIKTKILKEFKYNESFICAQDFELYHRLIHNGYNISYDKLNVTYKLRIHGDSISGLYSSEQIKMLKEVLKKYNYKYYSAGLYNKFFFLILDLKNFIFKK